MKSQLRSVTVQASILNITSSILAQMLMAYRKADAASTLSSLNPLGLQVVPILQFLLFCIISTPPNFLWQEYLERRFPGYPTQADKPKEKVEDEKNIPPPNAAQKLDVKNTGIKFALDQTVGALANTAAFIVGITLIRGGSLNDCANGLKADLWPIIMTGYKIWPIVSLLNFLVVPVERRVVVASAVGLFWNVYMVLRVTA